MAPVVMSAAPMTAATTVAAAESSDEPSTAVAPRAGEMTGQLLSADAG
jgi:hypothetical protein